MLKNGRPYSNENGYADTELITDESKENQAAVANWIRTNISHRRTINKRHTSYGLKHILEQDTGIYLTNNAFKDAMLFAGYEPTDPNELNWHYRIRLREERW